MCKKPSRVSTGSGATDPRDSRFRVPASVSVTNPEALASDCHEGGPPLVTRSGCHRGASSKEARLQCCTPDWISVDRKVDVCLLNEEGEHLDQLAVPPDSDSLRTLARRIDEVHREPVCAVVESMTGARLVHDTLEHEGWDVEIADAQKVKGLAPLACKTDRIDSMVLAVLSQRDLVPAIWLPDPRIRTMGTGPASWQAAVIAPSVRPDNWAHATQAH
jgi:hypothetical protein